MSVYCKVALLLSDKVDSHNLLSQFAVETFGAREAVRIDERQFGIDNGMNDVRAVLKEDKNLITFCCRYEKDLQRTEDKIHHFAQLYDLQIVEV